MRHVMSFERYIAAKRDPVEGLEAAARSIRPAQPTATLVLNGTFDDSAARNVLTEIEQLVASGKASIVIDMQDVRVTDLARLGRFVEDVMALRGAAADVQIAVRDAGLYDMMRALPDARDWLLSKPDAEPTGGRRSLHLDRHGGSTHS